MTMQTITPTVTPQQQMALAFRDFALPEGRVIAPKQVHVWTIRVDGAWVEAIGRDQVEAVHNLVREVARPGQPA